MKAALFFITADSPQILRENFTLDKHGRLLKYQHGDFSTRIPFP